MEYMEIEVHTTEDWATPTDNRVVVGVYAGVPRAVRYVADGDFWFDEARGVRTVAPGAWFDVPHELTP